MTQTPLAKGFSGPESYRRGALQLLPFRFTPLDDKRYVITNLVGEYLVLEHDELERVVDRRVGRGEPLYRELKAKHFLRDDTSDVAIELLATKYRSKQAVFREFTSLHIFVVTLRCEHTCSYCQVSRVSQDKKAFDMTEETARRSIDFMFESPSPVLKVEFQGGESLLNFDLIRYIVDRALEENDGRTLEFVIATNLSVVTDDMLDYCREHDILISTSLDGPRELHNKNRRQQGGDSYENAIDGIRRAREALGPHSVSALMTTTSAALEMPEAIIDEYVAQGFRSVFLRPINPYGFAVRAEERIGYAPEAFVEFYRRGLRHVLELNRRGIPFREDYAGIILTKALTPHGVGFVDLQSPAGIGSKVLVYNYDGHVYASDESRMLAEMGDFRFRLGNVNEQSYREVMLGSDLLEVLHETIAEGVPQCSDCAFLPWCGTDPVRHYRTQGDVVGHRPTSEFCARNMGIMKLLLEILESGGEDAEIPLRANIRETVPSLRLV